MYLYVLMLTYNAYTLLYNSMLLDDSNPPKSNFQFYEEEDQKSGEKCFVVQLQIVEECRNKLQWLSDSKNDRLKRLKVKEKDPEYIAKYEKMMRIREKDDKTREEWHKDEGNKKMIGELEWHNHEKDKFNFLFFDPFEWRGKHASLKYAHVGKALLIRIRKQYYLDELRLSPKELFNTAISFVITWENEYLGMLKLLWRHYLDTEQKHFYNITIRAIDLISVTFDIAYSDKKSYRFRYSPFEFKSIPYYKEEKELTGYNQTLSCLSEFSSSQKGAFHDSEFHMAPRMFIFDDLTDNNLFVKLGQRCNLFFQIYFHTRYNPTEHEQFSKKVFMTFYFSTTRLKKFIFTWSFKLHRHKPSREKDRDRRNVNEERRSLNEQKRMNLNVEEHEKEKEKDKQVVLHLPCYVAINGSEPFYHFRMQLLDSNKLMHPLVREEMSTKIREFLVLFKDTSSSGLNREYFAERQALLKRRDERETLGRGDYDDYEFAFSLHSKDKCERFFIGVQIIAGTVLDRHYFTLQQHFKREETHKLVDFQTRHVVFCKKRQEYYVHSHFLKLTLRHSYLQNMSPFLYRTDEHSDGTLRHNYQHSQLHYKHPQLESRYKLGEWKFERLCKVKRRVNIRSEKEPIDIENLPLLDFPKVYLTYINILLRHFTLRYIYKDILSFLQSVSKICYKGQEETNAFPCRESEPLYRKIIKTLIDKYYMYQFNSGKHENRERENEERQKERERQAERTYERSNDKERERERLQDGFSRVIVLKLIASGDSGFVGEANLQGEITFRLLQLKQVWTPRIHEGHIVIRVFADRIDFQKQYETIYSIRLDQGKGQVDEALLLKGLQLCETEGKAMYMI